MDRKQIKKSICRNCGVKLTEKNWYQSGMKINNKICKKCFREYKRNYKKKLRRKILELLGGKCIRCGFNDPRALQIDHINGGGTKERKKLNGTIPYYNYILANLESYQVLCANCNWIKRYENNENQKRISN